MSFRRVATYACLALAAGWGFFPSSAHACGLFRWLFGGNDATTAYYAPYTSYYAPTGGCGTGGYAAQRPQVSWMPVTNYATTAVTVPVTSYRPNLFGGGDGGGLFGCRSHTTMASRVPVPITNFMPVAQPACNTCPQTSYSLPVQTVYQPPVSCCPTNTCPTTSYAPPVTYSAPACSTCAPATTSYSLPTTTTYGPPATTTIVEPSSSCSCGSHASSAPVGTGALVGNPTSTYSNGPAYSGTNGYSNNNGYAGANSTVPADSRPSLGSNEAPRIDGNSLGLPETSYSTNYGNPSLSLSAPEVRIDSSVIPGPIRGDSSVQFGVPSVRPLDSSSRPMNLHSAATDANADASAFGVAPMRDPETRDRDGRLLAPPLLDPRAKTASLPPVGVRPAFDDRIPVMAASFRVETPASLIPVSASLASADAAPAIQHTGLRPIEDVSAMQHTGLRLIEDAPVAHTTAKVAVDYPVPQSSFGSPGSFATPTSFAAPAPVNQGFAPQSGGNVTQLDESLWQSAR
ncbi:MAG TPA: hypothetical protein VGN57_07140 [Pirellulaceae bacterium]|jgi:hypothetical protein|nr:hypothetical protein [Pirellulaceae bacterium]